MKEINSSETWTIKLQINANDFYTVIYKGNCSMKIRSSKLFHWTFYLIPVWGFSSEHQLSQQFPFFPKNLLTEITPVSQKWTHYLVSSDRCLWVLVQSTKLSHNMFNRYLNVSPPDGHWRPDYHLTIQIIWKKCFDIKICLIRLKNYCVGKENLVDVLND